MLRYFGLVLLNERIRELMALTSTTLEASQYIDGAWRTATGPTIEAIDPSNEQVITTLPSSGSEDVTAALHAARRAFPEWSHLPVMKRGDYLRAIAELFAENDGMLAELLVKEVGKPMAQARAEVGFAEALIRYNADWDRRLEGEILPGEVPGEVIHLL